MTLKVKAQEKLQKIGKYERYLSTEPPPMIVHCFIVYFFVYFRNIS